MQTWFDAQLDQKYWTVSNGGANKHTEASHRIFCLFLSWKTLWKIKYYFWKKIILLCTSKHVCQKMINITEHVARSPTPQSLRPLGTGLKYIHKLRLKYCLILPHKLRPHRFSRMNKSKTFSFKWPWITTCSPRSNLILK